MRLNEVLKRLAKKGIYKIGTWKFRGRHGITLGDPERYFPFYPGPRYPVDTTDGPNRELKHEEIAAIERRFDT